MLVFLRQLFLILSNVDRFLRTPLIKDFNGFMVIWGSLLLLSGCLVSLDNKLGTKIFSNLSIFMIVSIVSSFIPYLFYKSGTIRKFLIFGNKESIEVVTKRFNFIGYCLFVIFFSYFLLFPVIGIPLFFNLFNAEWVSTWLSNNISFVIYFLITVSSILWFSYHIINVTVTLPKIKIKLALYSAVGTSLTLINFRGFEYISIVLSCLLASYLWIQYLIELKSDE